MLVNPPGAPSPGSSAWRGPNPAAAVLVSPAGAPVPTGGAASSAWRGPSPWGAGRASGGGPAVGGHPLSRSSDRGAALATRAAPLGAEDGAPWPPRRAPASGRERSSSRICTPGPSRGDPPRQPSTGLRRDCDQLIPRTHAIGRALPLLTTDARGSGSPRYEEPPKSLDIS
jgi:hypothetical protein